jgi:archaemetzincin
MAFKDSPLFESLRLAVEDTFGIKTGIMTQMPLPSSAYDPNRAQYCSSYILQCLHLHMPPDATRLLAITGADLYVPQFNYVFGQATVDGNVSIISTHRLRSDFYGEPPNKALLEERAVKEAVHELGHTFGLRHCTNPDCVMHFSNKVEDTDRKTAKFYDDCANLLEAKLSEVRFAA